jgi:hypothetical protein
LRWHIEKVLPGAFTGSLSNSGEKLTLQKPTLDSATNALVYADVDWLRYSVASPWPVEANGGGKALLRLAPDAPDKRFAIGPEPLNWGIVCYCACVACIVKQSLLLLL